MKVSVVLPVYNAAKFVSDAVQSILDQTFSDFELILIDDASTDDSYEILKRFHDPRIKLLKNEVNLDLVGTLNRGLAESKGEYIVRMDADDIAMPERIAIQVEYMDKHPQVGVCGSWYEMFDGATGIGQNPEGHDEIKARLFFSNVIAHPTVIMRSAMLKDLKYERYLAEDYELWQRASFLFELHNLPLVLLKYRISKQSYSQVNSPKVWQVLGELSAQNLSLLGISLIPEQLDTFKRVCFGVEIEDLQKLKAILPICAQIVRANSRVKRYPVLEFKKEMFRLILISLSRFNLSQSQKIKLALSYSPTDLSVLGFIARELKLLVKEKLS